MNRRTFLKNLVTTSTAVALSGCPPFSLTQPTDSLYYSQHQNKVLLIGIDGLRPDALEAAKTPNLDHLITHGAYSNHAKSGEYTVSAPGWSNILTGVWEKKHGVKDNSFRGAKYDRYPSLFTRLEKSYPSLYTASIVSWEPINDKIIPHANKRYSNHEDDHLVMKSAVDTLNQENPDLLFVYFGDVDLAGHKYGFHPSVVGYRREIEEVDHQIGSVLQALCGRKNYSDEDWLILCTTDHGGRRAGHGQNTPEDRTIFYLASGKSVQPGKISGTPQQVDIVPTILQHLRIPSDLSWGLDGKVCGL